ncbi:CRISPR-associated endoribonuclease Cas6 [Thermodesulfobacterium sp. TA1]|uniref:CRISPR-associated endoribonuclease Cas6 n=1 Tax=Thermodesulfobacterium sp. TA1 TaxID=2234087 RepID=UPI001232713E|nr:CRISPR-associated endoribonuclease Cas6 [Thermodesulfobacterium sp. TA1]QER42557.1 CRISPR-associated endoribonuclease Cas6 [Thermodesulfobacterium sp. TA1]
MRLAITFVSEKEAVLPIHYNEVLQGLIYHLLDRALAEKLHNEGFVYQKRRFKFFTFSRIFGKLEKERDKFKISSPFKFFISSPYTEMLLSLTSNFLYNKEIQLDVNRVWLESIKVLPSPEIRKEILIRMLSPLTVYSTLYGADGKKKTYYYHPNEKNFSMLVKENIIKKYKAFYKKMPPSEEFFIEPIKLEKGNEKIIIYKGFVIKGWMGNFVLRGDPELLRLAYDAGLGAKNSQGFGMFEVIK